MRTCAQTGIIDIQTIRCRNLLWQRGSSRIKRAGANPFYQGGSDLYPFPTCGTAALGRVWMLQHRREASCHNTIVAFSVQLTDAPSMDYCALTPALRM